MSIQQPESCYLRSKSSRQRKKSIDPNYLCRDYYKLPFASPGLLDVPTSCPPDVSSLLGEDDYDSESRGSSVSDYSSSRQVTPVLHRKNRLVRVKTTSSIGTQAVKLEPQDDGDSVSATSIFPPLSPQSFWSPVPERPTSFDFTENSIARTQLPSITEKRCNCPRHETLMAGEDRQDTQGIIVPTTLAMKVPSTKVKDQSNSICEYDTSNADQRHAVEDGILKWVDATRDRSIFSAMDSPPSTNASISNRGFPAVPAQVLGTIDASIPSTRTLVLELWNSLQDNDRGYDTREPSLVCGTPSYDIDAIISPRTTERGSASNGSSKSSATSNLFSTGGARKSSLSPGIRASGRDDEEDQLPRKKPNRQRDPAHSDAPDRPIYSDQMPCPLLEMHQCQGTNTTISELLRSLKVRHRIVICKDCCKLLPIEDLEKKAGDVLQKHTSEGCEPRCIGISCSDRLADTASHHRRSERCPSWATLSKEERWKFIWKLVNPGSDSLEPNFLPGPGFEHSQIRRPSKRQALARGNEICAQLMRDVEAKERRISTLENDLITTKNENVQSQRRCNEKIDNLENIIESLLERLCENNIGLPGSLRKRVQNECPQVTATILAKDIQTAPTPSPLISTPNPGYYSVSDVSPTWQNNSWPPPAMTTIPATWGAVPQQMVEPNPGYYFPEFSEQAPTTSAMYPTNAYVPDSMLMSIFPSTMYAQVKRHSSSGTPETLQPYE